MSRILILINPTRAPIAPPIKDVAGLPFTVGAGQLRILSPGATIDWGDGSPPEIAGANAVTHNYTGGPWQGVVSMDPAVDGEHYLTGSALVSIDAWPTDKELPTRLAFSHWSATSSNLESVPTSTPPGVRNVSGMFRDTNKFNTDISGWRIPNPTDMSNMFFNAKMFNRDLSSWVFPNISSEPYQFSTGATAWVLPKPVWGGG